MKTISYKEVKTITTPDMVARIYSPDLSQAERESRIKAIHKATVDLMISIKKGEHALT